MPTRLFVLVILLCIGHMANAQPITKDKGATFHASAAHAGVYDSGIHDSFGTLKWKFQTGGKVFSSPAVYNGTIFIGSEDHNLYAINEKTGKMQWKFATHGAVHSSPAVYKNVAYFGSFDGYYYAVNTVTGKLIWRFKTGGEKLVGAKAYGP